VRIVITPAEGHIRIQGVASHFLDQIIGSINNPGWRLPVTGYFIFLTAATFE
jgi:hypothetical protein